MDLIKNVAFLLLLAGTVLGSPADNKENTEPDVVTTSEPDDPTTKKPDDPTTTTPDNSTKKTPDDSTTSKPDDPTTKQPDDPTTTKPVDKTTKKPIDKTPPTTPLISIGVDTGEKLVKLGETAKESVKKPSDLVKESVKIIKDGAKLGSELGEAAVTKGIVELGRQGVATVSDLGKMGINVTTVIANNTLGLIHKIGDMMPVGGRLVKGGALIGRKGLSVAKTLGENMLDNLVWLADNGFAWLRSAASTSRSYFDNKTDSVASSVDRGIDGGAGRLGQMISAGISKLPIFRVNASLHLG